MKHIVALSGGKDSTAMALALAEKEPREYIYVCTPTGNELPEMIDHWNKVSGLLGSSVFPVTSGKSLQGLIREQAMLPNHRARWCTRMLKLEPYYNWLATQTPCVSYVGLRADELSRPGMIFPDAGEIKMRFPLQEWGWDINDVWKYLDDRGISIPKRTDCAACFWQRLPEWWELWKENPDLYQEAVDLEKEVSAKRGKDYTFRSPSRDTWPASLELLRDEFKKGRTPRGVNKQQSLLRDVGTCRVCTL